MHNRLVCVTLSLCPLHVCVSLLLSCSCHNRSSATAAASRAPAPASPRGKQLGTAGTLQSGGSSGSSGYLSVPVPGINVLDPIAASAAQASARRRSRSSRSRTSSAAGDLRRASDAAAVSDIEQPPHLTPRSPQRKQLAEKEPSGRGATGPLTWLGSLGGILGECAAVCCAVVKRSV